MFNSISKTIDTALQSMARDGELSIRISGNCMQPLIKDGALICVRKQSFYWPGDILVKRGFDGQLMAHRLIGFFPRKGRLYFVSRADSAANADVPVTGSQIIGRVSGGECAESVVLVPVLYRIKAVGQFGWLVAKRLAYRFMHLFQGQFT